MSHAYQQTQTARPCPVCGNLQPDLLYEQVFATFSEGSLLAGYDVATCKICGCGYADHIPPQSTFDQYYREMSKYEFGESSGKEQPYDAARFDALAELIAPLITHRTARVLDVGCATGGLLNRIKNKGFSQVTGLDPSPACSEAAWQQYGLPVLTQTISGLDSIKQTFDFVILVGVLEHIRDLGAHLGMISGILDGGGRVFIEVPDALRFDDWPDAPYQQFSMEHINFFSPLSLRNLMRRNGYTPIMEQQNQRDQSNGTVMPVVSAVFECINPSLILERCAQTRPALLRYVQTSQKVEARLQKVIDEFVDSQRSLLVWGTGTHTLRLMETSRLSQANIVAFIDSNPHYQGKQLYNIPIISPAEAANYFEPVLISSRVFQSEIASRIRNVLHMPNELILLYNI